MSYTIPIEPDAGTLTVPTRPVHTRPFGRRLAAVALIVGAAGNTAESAALRAFLPSGRTPSPGLVAAFFLGPGCGAFGEVGA